MMVHIRFAAAASAGLAALIAAASPAAADEKKGESAYVKSLRECQGKTDAAERLACFDTAVAAMVSASSEGEVRVVDREEVRATRRRLFGFNLPDFGIFGGKDDKDSPGKIEDIGSLETTISKVRMDRGTIVITTAEGAEWQLDETPTRLMRPRVGQPMEIRSGALSSYFLRINGQKGVKGRRVR